MAEEGSPPQNPMSPHPRWRRLLPLAVAALAMLPYLPTLAYGFIGADRPWLEENTHLRWADLLGYWRGGGFGYAGVGEAALYDPLAWTVWLAQAQLGGHEGAVRVFRVVSLALHCANAALVAALVGRLGRRWPLYCAAIAGLWFAWAPLQAEVVCWPSAQGQLVAALLLLAGARLMLAASPAALVGGGLLVGLAPLAWPLCLPLALLGPPGVSAVLGPTSAAGGEGASLRSRGLGVAAAWAAVALGVALAPAIEGGAAARGLRAVASVGHVGLELMALTGAQAAPSYLRPVPEDFLELALGGVCLVLVLLAVGLKTRGSSQGRALAAGALWMALSCLTPAARVLEVGYLPDRGTYLPLAGLVLCVAAGLSLVSELEGLRWRWLPPAGACLVLALLLQVNLSERARFADGVAFFSRERLLWPSSAEAAWELGRAYAYTGDMGSAAALLSVAHRKLPARLEIIKLLFQAQMQGGQVAQAVEVLREGVALAPDDSYLAGEAAYWLSPEAQLGD